MGCDNFVNECIVLSRNWGSEKATKSLKKLRALFLAVNSGKRVKRRGTCRLDFGLILQA